MVIEIKPHKWIENGESYHSDFFPFIDGIPRFDLADCKHCAFYIPDGDCRKSSEAPNDKLYLFCGNICGYFRLVEVEE